MKRALFALLGFLAFAGVAHAQSTPSPNGVNGPVRALGTLTTGKCIQGAGGNYISATTTACGGGSATPSGPAGGDLGGTYPNPTVVNLQNVTTGAPTLSGLTVTGNASLSGTTTLGTAQIGAGNATLTNLTAATVTGTTIVSNTALTSKGTTTLSGLTTGYLNVNGSGVVASTAISSFNPSLQPLSVTTTDTAGNEFPYTYFDGTTTGGGAIGAPSWGTAASLGANTSIRFRFKMPPTLPASGTLNLCTLCQANATSGVVKYTITDADIAVNNTASVGATVLNSETQTSITWSAADNYVETCTPLTETPVANHISAGAVTFNTTGWTLAQILSCNFTESWR